MGRVSGRDRKTVTVAKASVMLAWIRKVAVRIAVRMKKKSELIRERYLVGTNPQDIEFLTIRGKV